MKKLLAMILSFLCIMGLASCQQQDAAVPGSSIIIEDDPAADSAKALIQEYLKTTGPYSRTYFAGEEVGEPQENDQRIDKAVYVGEAPTGEATGVAFWVEQSYYRRWHSDDSSPSWRSAQEGIYVILGRDADGTYYEVRGAHSGDENASVGQIIQEVSYQLMDLEVSLWRDGCPVPAGPGSEISFFQDDDDGVPQVEVLDGWEPIYWPGAYWSRQKLDGFTALCYHFGEEPGRADPDAYSVYTIHTSRPDLKTYRGIRVGTTRAEVLEAYPELYDTNYWDDTDPDFPGEDYLWYCKNEDGLGAVLMFFFDGDRVSQIRLEHRFN